MPLFSEQIANMYYGASPSYSGHSYGYSSPSYGSSYSASYLNPGGSYSSHSSLGGYSRTPLTSRWISGVGRNYSPMLTTISERGSASPVRINSPRRLPISSRTYGTSSYTPRPVNINTADIDVSKDRYRHRTYSAEVEPPKQKESTITDNENSPFMPRVDGKPETGIDSSPGVQRSTIKRGRPVVRLYTIKRKERDSPRKPSEDLRSPGTTDNTVVMDSCAEDDKKEPLKWRERLSEDLVYKEKKDKKSLGAKLVEKFLVQESDDKVLDVTTTENAVEVECEHQVPITPTQNVNFPANVPLDRRCSMELLAEQANLLDSLIRSENLSIATLDLSKVGVVDKSKNNFEAFDQVKRRRQDHLHNPLKTTRSDHSLHESLKNHKESRDFSSLSKRRSIKKSASGSCIRRLDSITEFPKEPINIELPAIEESLVSMKQEKSKPKLKPKLKTKITSSVEVSAPMSPLKFRVEDVTVEEKPRTKRKEITYSSEVHEPDLAVKMGADVSQDPLKIKKKSRKVTVTPGDLESPEPADGNFWDKIGKRETVYLIKRKQYIEQNKEKHKRELFWFPEEEEGSQKEESMPKKTVILPAEINTEINNVQEIEKQSVSDIQSRSENDRDLTPIKILTVKLETEDKDKQKFVQPDHQLEEVKQEIIKRDPIIIQEEYKSSYPAERNIQTDSTTEKEIDFESKNAVVIPNDVDSSGSDKETDIKCKPLLDSDNVIGKSASLESVSKTNVKVGSTKKAKSEKTHNPNKKDDSKSSDAKPPSPLMKSQCQSAKTRRKSVEDKGSKNKSSVTNKIHDKSLPPLSQSQSKVSVGDVLKKKSESSVKIKKVVSLKKPEELLKEESQDVHSKSMVSEPFKNKDGFLETETTPANKTDHLDSIVVCESKLTDSNVVSEDSNNKSSLDISLKDKSNETLINKTESLMTTNTSCEEKPKRSPPTGTDSSAKNEGTQSVVKEATENNIVPNISNSLLVNLQKQTESLDMSEPVHTSDIPIPQPSTEEETHAKYNKKAGEDNKADNNIIKDDEKSDITVPQIFTPKKPVKEEKALKPLIATPRPLQKRVPQVIHSSDSSDSSEEESSEEEDESDTSEDSNEFFECENNADGRTSTGSNDSGFDSSAPTSPATFTQIRKDCDVNCHRKCEKLTANLCGVNQRLLVEALASRTASKKGGDNSGATSSKGNQSNNIDIVEQQLEQSTAYDIFRKTGRFTPPARSIPRFRKYTIEDFQFIKVLGKGSFGKVLLAELRDTEYYYAVKCLKKDVVLEDDDVECTLIERKVLALGTNHPYLCHLFATFQTDSHLFFVMEYLNGGDLMFHIQQSGRFPEVRARFYAAEIVSGLKFLHKRGIVYRDLKLDNILLDYEGHVRIADFGMCKLQIYLDKTADTFCGTPDYMAPEIIKGLKYNQTVDWWSFGVLLYEMLIGQSPFSGCDEDELFWSICNEMPSYPRFLSHEALTILTRLLDKDARTRLGGTECMHGDIRDQDFFHPVHWDRLERRDLEAPFRPRVRHPMDTQYFDRAFTGERPRLTAVEPHVLRSMDQEPFRGFSYTNPNTTDH